MVVKTRNPVRSVLFLVLTFFNAALFLFIMGVEYISYVFIIVYVGAIAILFLFVVMMLNLAFIEKVSKSYLERSKEFIFFILNFLFFFFLVYSINIFLNSFNEIVLWNDLKEVVGSEWINSYFFKEDIYSMGFILYFSFFLEFFLSAFILLVAMLGSIALTIDCRNVLEETIEKKQDIYIQISKRSNIFFKKKKDE